MKYLIIFLSFVFYSVALPAQDKGKDIATEVVTVKGNCGECKERIEKAAYIKGVKRAEWDKETKELTVTYRPSKTNTDDILKSIADVGHDSDKYISDDKVYNKLPGCCQYRTNTCDH